MNLASNDRTKTKTSLFTRASNVGSKSTNASRTVASDGCFCHLKSFGHNRCCNHCRRPRAGLRIISIFIILLFAFFQTSCAKSPVTIEGARACLAPGDVQWFGTHLRVTSTGTLMCLQSLRVPSFGSVPDGLKAQNQRQCDPFRCSCFSPLPAARGSATLM
jgi:hypothetical protein